MRAFAGILPMFVPKSPGIPAGMKDIPSESSVLIIIYRGLDIDPCRFVLVEQFPVGYLIACGGGSSRCPSKDKYLWLHMNKHPCRGSSVSHSCWVVGRLGVVVAS